MSIARRIRNARTERIEQRRRSTHYLSFAAAGRTFGIRIAAVHEILEFEPPMELPLMPAFIRGVTDLRGVAVPVIDLSQRLSGQSGPVTRNTSIIIAEMTVRETPVLMGIVVDAVYDVLEIADDTVEPRPDFGDAIRTAFMQGITRNTDGSLLILLDADHLLNGEDLSALLRVGEQAADAPTEHAEVAP